MTRGVEMVRCPKCGRWFLSIWESNPYCPSCERIADGKAGWKMGQKMRERLAIILLILGILPIVLLFFLPSSYIYSPSPWVEEPAYFNYIAVPFHLWHMAAIVMVWMGAILLKRIIPNKKIRWTGVIAAIICTPLWIIGFLMPFLVLY
jgi:uncharacterized protein (DUF983 family)